MILVGNQRGGSKDLALHLMKDENERVVVDEIRGFASTTLNGAFQESYAISKATRCKQHLYSLSFSPPKEEDVAPDVFRDAIDRAEERLGLKGQPRAIVFHEKRGLDGEVRRHAHAVWCRIDTDNMRAIQLSFTKRKLQNLGRELYLEHGWQMPRGFVRSQDADPRNYTLAEWQQAKRAEKDPQALKTLFQDCWAISDSQATFAHALKERGYILARGDRRGFIAVDHKGEAYSISKWTGINNSKKVRARLTDMDALPDKTEAHAQAATIVTDRLKELQAEQRRVQQETLTRLKAQRERQDERQRAAAALLKETQTTRFQAEEAARQAKIRKGVLGFIDRLTGKRKRTEAENIAERLMAQNRDREERSALAAAHSQARETLTEKAERVRNRSRETIRELSRDIDRLQAIPRPTPRVEPTKEKERKPRRTRRERSRDGP